METTGAKSVRPLSSTDGEVVSEIAEEREESVQLGHDEGTASEAAVSYLQAYISIRGLLQSSQNILKFTQMQTST